MTATKPKKKPKPPVKKKKRAGGCWRLVLILSIGTVLVLSGLVYLLLRESKEEPAKKPVITETRPAPKPKKTPLPATTRVVPSPSSPPPASKASLRESVPPDFEPVARDSKAGVLALVIDDIGHKEGSLEGVAALKVPLAISILPDGRLAKSASEFGKKVGWDVLVHLPMESATGVPETSTIRRRNSNAEIEKAVTRAIELVPGSIGVNNHQGSLATADRRVMAAVLGVVRQHHLFFLDSRTTKGTVAIEEARRLGVSARSRDIFLDDPEVARETGGEAQGLAKSWEAALALVSKRGDCVAIGHPHRETLEFLATEIPRAQARGVRFVRISELVD